MNGTPNTGAGGNERPHEIIIIKRKRGGHHDGHHGGVWKIAYADFVTAMMAFFLVMWLINASNEETKAAVASYFNPVKLMDTTSNPKGVKDAAYGASSSDVPADADTPLTRSDMRKNAADATETQNGVAADETIFRDPYAVLTEIAGGTGATSVEGSQTGVDDSVPRPGMRGGLAYRDPFEPEFWENREPPATAVAPDAAPADIAEQAISQLEPVAETEPVAPPAPIPVPQAPATPDPVTPSNADSAAQTDAEALAASIARSAQEAGLDASKVTVTQGEGSLIINMTDGSDFSMFESGSARPLREVVLLMERIAAVLKDKPGSIEISGHTDARPFTTGNYDNWRLSSARAQMAYYMLARAGVPESRITAVTGHAERKPKNAADINAAENRRIEIRLVMPKDGTP